MASKALGRAGWNVAACLFVDRRLGALQGSSDDSALSASSISPCPIQTVRSKRWLNVVEMASPDILEERYPVSCPFCAIARTYPARSGPIPLCNLNAAQTNLDCVPQEVDVNAIQPSCYLVLSAPEVMAFLDIMPMTRGHLLVTTRKHRRKIGDVKSEEAQDIGGSAALI